MTRYYNIIFAFPVAIGSHLYLYKNTWRNHKTAEDVPQRSSNRATSKERKEVEDQLLIAKLVRFLGILLLL